jgi:hypothetical protein
LGIKSRIKTVSLGKGARQNGRGRRGMAVENLEHGNASFLKGQTFKSLSDEGTLAQRNIPKRRNMGQ